MSEPMERKVYTVQEFHWLEDENAALRARAEQAERERGGGLSGGRGATSIVGGR